MHWLMLLSSRRWVSALSGSASGRIGEFREARKGLYALQPTENARYQQTELTAQEVTAVTELRAAGT
jgi:hypothetical protein